MKFLMIFLRGLNGIDLFKVRINFIPHIFSFLSITILYFWSTNCNFQKYIFVYFLIKFFPSYSIDFSLRKISLIHLKFLVGIYEKYL